MSYIEDDLDSDMFFYGDGVTDIEIDDDDDVE